MLNFAQNQIHQLNHIRHRVLYEAMVAGYGAQS